MYLCQGWDSGAGKGETLGESLGFSYSTLGDVRIPALVYTRAD